MPTQSRQAFIKVQAPDGRQGAVTVLDGDRVTVGRPTPHSRPDISLEPDPEQLISRQHCFLEREGGAWWLSDSATPNGTFLRHRDADAETVLHRQRLEDGDVICILGDHGPNGPRFWELTFHDPFATHRGPSGAVRQSVCLEYDDVQAKLFRRQASRRTELPQLSPKAHRLIRYMVSRNDHAGAPVACTHDELITALWGNPDTWAHRRSYTRENLRDLVSDLRQRIEDVPTQPQLLQAVPGHGYRLVTCPREQAPEAT